MFLKSVGTVAFFILDSEAGMQLKIPRESRYRFTRLARISHQISAAAADPGMSAALRSVGILPSRWPKRQMRLVSMTICAASRRNQVRNAG
jgi:hypothetical protein